MIHDIMIEKGSVFWREDFCWSFARLPREKEANKVEHGQRNQEKKPIGSPPAGAGGYENTAVAERVLPGGDPNSGPRAGRLRGVLPALLTTIPPSQCECYRCGIIEGGPG